MLVKVVAFRDAVEIESTAVRSVFDGQALGSGAVSLDMKQDMVMVSVGSRRYGVPMSNVRHVEFPVAAPAKGGGK